MSRKQEARWASFGVSRLSVLYLELSIHVGGRLCMQNGCKSFRLLQRKFNKRAATVGSLCENKTTFSMHTVAVCANLEVSRCARFE